MTRVLFVSNGHGEAAIADRIARELHEIDPECARDHLALVGSSTAKFMREVGPRKTMPSGGLIAMGNLKNLLRDVGAGLLPLVAGQRRFLRASRGAYDAVVAVGDVYCLAMARRARTKTVFVGTAKSVRVAPYGRFETRLISRAQASFVRDDATVRSLREAGVNVEPAANVIVDLFTREDDPQAVRASDGFDPVLVLFPGSRPSAYGDAAFLLAVARAIAAANETAGAVLSLAPGLDQQRFAAAAREAGFDVSGGSAPHVPFVASLQGRIAVRAWSGSLDGLLAHVDLVLGQAGTANEGAAAAGVPVVAFERERDTASRWYRQRQQGLLGDALLVLPGEVSAAVSGVEALLNDPQRRRHMGDAGRARMGSPGGARRIAARVLALAHER